MDDKNNPINSKDIKTLLVCLVLLFFIFIIPQFGYHIQYFREIIEFNSTSYPYSNPPIFFSIGEALSAIAILFAVYQFKKEKWNLALRIRSYIQPVVLICISLGIIFSIFSSLASFEVPTNIFQLSIFWQITSSLLIAFSIIFLLTKASNKNLFNKKNSRRFYEALVWEISRPDERLNLALNVLLDNFENICKSASIEPFNSETNQSARAILDVILSDRSVVDLLATKRLDGLLYIIATVKKYNISSRHSPQGIPRIVQGLFFNPDSFLYKHLDNSGSALSSNIYTSLFESPVMLTNFDLFGYPTISYPATQNTADATVNVFVQSVSKSIETYLKSGNVPARHINNGIAHLSGIFGELCSKMSFEKDNETKYGLKEGWWSLHKIASFLSHDYVYLGKPEEFNNSVVEIEKTAQETNFHSNSTINEGISAALYKAFEQLSRFEKSNDTYGHVIELLEGITHEPNYKEGYRVPFENRIWQQIGKNVLGRHYPMVLRTYLNYIGFCLASDDGQRRGWAGEQAEKMRRLLYIDLKPQLDSNGIMVDDTPMKEALLPDCMDYKDGKFTYTMGFGRGPTKEIPPPPEGSTSALEGVEWEHARSLT